MGSVWLARQLSLDVPCALKFLHPDAAASADMRARFEREAKAAAQLRSPNVVHILDHGVWEGMPFIAMELLDGEDLDQRLRRVRRLEPRAAALIVSQVARALTRAHAGGLVHRDLKPGNIFLARDDDREIAKVLDFGVAKRTQYDVGDNKTKTGSLLGTPFYMSPEQARGLREVDHRTDLWALGVITFLCLTGRLPFQSEALGDLFMKIIHEPLPVPSTFAPLPPAFDQWWIRAAARDPAQRFQSARELSDGLTLALGISASSAAPDLPQALTVAPASVPAPHDTIPLAAYAAATPGALSPPTAGAVAVPAAPPKPARTVVITAGVALALAAAGAVVLLRAGSEKPASRPPRPASADVSGAASIRPAVAPNSASVAPASTAAASASAEPHPAASTMASSAPRPSPRSPSAPKPPIKPLPATPAHHDDGI